MELIIIIEDIDVNDDENKIENINKSKDIPKSLNNSEISVMTIIFLNKFNVGFNIFEDDTD